jgi:hypothetical protein
LGWDVSPGEEEIEVRTTNQTGYVQVKLPQNYVDFVVDKREGRCVCGPRVLSKLRTVDGDPEKFEKNPQRKRPQRSSQQSEYTTRALA